MRKRRKSQIWVKLNEARFRLIQKKIYVQILVKIGRYKASSSFYGELVYLKHEVLDIAKRIDSRITALMSDTGYKRWKSRTYPGPIYSRTEDFYNPAGKKVEGCLFKNSPKTHYKGIVTVTRKVSKAKKKASLI